MKRLIPIALLFASAVAGARVISYAPYTNRDAGAALQSRLNRHFVLMEFEFGSPAQVVLYDTKGEEEPRVIWPSQVSAAAVREDDAELAIFLQTGYGAAALSLDGGATWKKFAIPVGNPLTTWYTQTPESGGLYVHARGAALRIGTREMPFVFRDAYGIYGVTRGGELKLLVANRSTLLFGSSRDGRLPANGVRSTRPRFVRKRLSSDAPRISSVSPGEPDWKLFSGGIRKPYVPPLSSIVYVREVTRTLVSAIVPCWK